MKPEEADRIIAEFMGWKFKIHPRGLNYVGYNTDRYWHLEGDTNKYEAHPEYSESLDELVPVWEKLKLAFEISLGITKFGKYCLIQREIENKTISHEKTSLSIQQAAAIATAKAIKESQGK